MTKMLELEALLVDAPGSLLRFIEPLSDNGANIHGIWHFHDRKTSDNKVPVLVTFGLSDPVDERLERIKAGLAGQDIHVVRILKKRARDVLNVVLVGHVFQRNFVDTILRLSQPGIQVKGIQAEFTAPEDVSTVKFTILLDGVEFRPRVLEILEDICKEKELFLIPEV
ncbi:MAG: hypothetical protein ACTSU5_03235 [Promethearchaeota archaeon]